MISAATFLLPILSNLVIIAARLIELGTRRNIIAGIVRENLTLRLFLVTGFLALASSIAEYVLTERGISWGFFTVGWLLAIGSFWIRRRAIHALGQFWSLHVEIRENHEFITNGPFRFVRHPAYLSMIMELMALALICNARFSLLLVMIAFTPVLLMRIRLEESALVGKFGDAYLKYQQTTPALIPRPW